MSPRGGGRVDQTDRLLDFAADLETAKAYLSTILESISRAVQDADEATALTLVECARRFTSDIGTATGAIYEVLYADRRKR